ncbi:unnamed protein product [Closterium sp. NIES-53]
MRRRMTSLVARFHRPVFGPGPLTFYHPPLHRFFDYRDARFDESVPYYVRYPCRGFPSSSQPTADPVGAGFRYEDPGGASSRGAGVGAESVSVRGPGSGGAGVGAEPMTAGDSSLRGAGVSGAVPGGATTGGAPSAGLGEPGTDPVTSGGAGSGGGATGSLESGPGATTAPDTTPPHPYPNQHQARVRRAREEQLESSSSSHLLLLSLVFGPSVSPLLLLPPPPLLPSLVLRFLLLTPPQLFSLLLCPRCPLLFLTLGLRITLLVLVLRPLFPSLTFILFCSSQPRLSPSVIPSPESALTASLSIRVTDYYRTYCPVLSRVLASLVTDPRASLSSVSALTAAVTEFASTRCLDYATSLVAAPPTNPLDVGGESALGCDALEDRQFELEFLTAASPHLNAMLLAPEGDPDALDIPTPCTYAEAIFRVKRPPGSPPVFKARYVARGFSQREGVDFFQTFAPTLKMTTLRVLLYVAVQRDYELHSLDFSTAFLQGSLYEEVWLRRLSAFTCSFPLGTQWRLRQPLYGLCQAPRECHDTLCSTLSDLGFQPSSFDPSLFVRCGSTPLFVLVYVNDLVFATADRVALADVLLRFELQHSTVQRTPLAIDHRLTGPFPDEPFEPSGPYAELVGCLVYLMTCTRPDLAFPLRILARFVVPGRHRPAH